MLAAVLAGAAFVFATLRRDVEAVPCSVDSCPTSSASPELAGDPRITAAGNISRPNPSPHTEATARLVVDIEPVVALTLGDNQSPAGSLRHFERGYDATWGAFRSSTHPVAGNNEYEESRTASGYFSYFGSRSPGRFYSYDVGSWHLIALDSNCAFVAGCDPGSPQYDWLAKDLAENPAICTLAYWHHPRWSSGLAHGNSSAVAPLWALLYEEGADVVLSGHERNYERFAALDDRGDLDPTNGMVEFVVGTGGSGLDFLGRPDPHSLVRNDSTFGVLQLTLHPSSFDFSFKGVPGTVFADTGTGSCH